MVKKDCFGFVEHSELRSQGYCDEKIVLQDRGMQIL